MHLVQELKPQDDKYTLVLTNQAISRIGDINWAPHIPDLTPTDVCLCGYFKSKVYHFSGAHIVNAWEGRDLNNDGSLFLQPVLTFAFSLYMVIQSFYMQLST